MFPWRRKWQPTPVYLPGISHGWRSRAGYSPWGHKESDTTEQLHSLTHSLACVQSTSVSYLCSPDGLRGGSLSKKNFKDIHQRFLTLRQEETLIRKNWCKADKLQGKWCLTLKASVQFSCSVVSYSLRPHESQHARPPCPSPTPGVHSDSCPSSQ